MCQQHCPGTLLLLVTITCIGGHLVIEDYCQRQLTLVNYIKLIVTLCIATLVFTEYYLVPNGVRKLHRAYGDVIAYVEQKIYVQMPYDNFKCTFQRKWQLILAVFVAILVLKMIFVTYADIDSAEIAQLFVNNLKQFALMHILFHIEFVQFLMRTINAELKPMSMLNVAHQPTTIELLFTLRHCKHIHYRIWRVFRIVNVRFGWILIALLLAALLDISYASYWAWVYIHKSTQEHITLHRIMRK